MSEAPPAERVEPHSTGLGVLPTALPQRQRIIEEVERLKASGVKKTAALRRLAVFRSTYYGWLKSREPTARKPSVLSLTEAEREAVIEKKKRHPHLISDN